MVALPQVDVTWMSFAQLTAEHADGDGGVEFGRDRVRVKAEATAGRVTGGGVLDFGVRNLDANPPGTFANVVADLYVNYRPAEGHLLRIGQFKTPLGMDFNMPGHELDLTKRGMEAALVLNRDIGLMLAGRLGDTAFGYDVGVFNPPGRSGATRYEAGQVGDENAAVGRIRYDAAPWHAELAYGESGAAGGSGSAPYEIIDAGLRYQGSNWNAKVEWLEGNGVHGVAGRAEAVYYVHGGYRLSPKLEVVARHYVGRSDDAGAVTRLTNTFLGATLQVFSTPRMNGRLQANYVLAGAHEAAYGGVGGYRGDTLLVQLQVYVEK
jgi:hypothetical protein